MMRSHSLRGEKVMGRKYRPCFVRGIGNSNPVTNAGLPIVYCERTNMIQRICSLLKDELLDNGYEYGFYLEGKIYKPELSKGFDKEFFGRLLSEYRVQNPKDTKLAKVGTCHDIVVLMKAILDEQGVPSKIWLLHDKQRGKFHTVLTFYVEGKTIYLELTPQSTKPWYGKEIVFDNEQSFISEYSKDGCEVIEITDSVIIGEAPEFVLSRMN